MHLEGHAVQDDLPVIVVVKVVNLQRVRHQPTSFLLVTRR